MVSIARKNLLEDIPRFLVAQAGIMFAVSLVTIQTGILNGFTRSTSLIVDQSQADLWITSPEMVNFELTDPLFYGQLAQVKNIGGIQQAEVINMGSSRWRPDNGESSPLKIIGFDINGSLFQPGKVIAGNLQDLKQPYTIMADQVRLGSMDLRNIGDIGKVEALPTKLVAITSGTQSIVSSTLLFTSLENAHAYLLSGMRADVTCKVGDGGNLNCTKIIEKNNITDKKAPNDIRQPKFPQSLPTRLETLDPIAYILVKAKPGEDLNSLKQKILQTLPDVSVYTNSEMSAKTRDYWQGRTSIGFVLGIGATVGIVVGIVVVAQILYSSVSDHIKEFATLKAMGAPDREIYSIIIEQSLWMAILGYLPGMLLCWGVSIWSVSKGIIILITPVSAVAVLGITVIMCMGSAFFAIQKVTRIDAALVFKA
jgi:putative ABC transport system permease protein